MSGYEGIGLPFEETFAGMLYTYGLKNDFSVLNAGVASYSPLLYYYKTKKIIEDVFQYFNPLEPFERILKAIEIITRQDKRFQ